MKFRFIAALVLPLLVCTAYADDDLHDESRHRPTGVAEDGHHHAHPGVDLSHPIVTESPLPETHVRLDYSLADTGDGKEHTLAASAEYAFTPNFSIEAVLPYSFIDPDDGGSANRLSDSILAVKFATYALADRHLVPAAGLEVVLPTGDEEDGIGSDHVLELEPFVRLGYWAGRFEFIGSLAVGVPVNQDRAEKDEEDFSLAYNLSTLYHVADDVQALFEIHGESIFGDASEAALYVSPGVTFQPFSDKSISIGVGATIPVTSDRAFDYAINVLTIVHF